jgi:hypothetical protein
VEWLKVLNSDPSNAKKKKKKKKYLGAIEKERGREGKG